MLPVNDRVTLVRLFYEHHGSISSTLRAFAHERGIKRTTDLPQENTIRALIARFESTGSVHDLPRTGRPKNLDGRLAVAEQVLVSHGEGCSTRTVIKESGISQSTVWRIMRKELSLFPYKVQTLQALTADDAANRKQFCVEFLERCDADDSFLQQIWWSDEANFSLAGVVNNQNVRVWGLEKPEPSQKPLNSPHVTVFICFNGHQLITPYFFQGASHESLTVNAARYCAMLQDHLFPLIHQCGPHHGVFQQNGATPHTAQSTRVLLTNFFGSENVISRGFPFQWPARSPDLTPCDFWLWGFLKTQVYSQGNFSSIEELKTKIIATCEQIDSGMLSSVMSNVVFRMNSCLEMEGHHIEHIIS